MNLGVLGLIVICIAWGVQLNAVYNKKKELQQNFFIAYIIGVALLIVDAFVGGFDIQAWLNAAVLVLVVLTYVKLTKR